MNTEHAQRPRAPVVLIRDSKRDPAPAGRLECPGVKMVYFEMNGVAGLLRGAELQRTRLLGASEVTTEARS